MSCVWGFVSLGRSHVSLLEFRRSSVLVCVRVGTVGCVGFRAWVSVGVPGVPVTVVSPHGSPDVSSSQSWES